MYSTWLFHLVSFYLLASCPLWVICQSVPTLLTTFDPNVFTVIMGQYYDVNVTFQGLDTGFSVGEEVYMTSSDDNVASTEFTYQIQQADIDEGVWRGSLEVYGNFLGYSIIDSRVRTASLNGQSSGMLNVTVIRPERIIDSVFTGSVATFVALIFINFGCAMHWPTVKQVLKRPIGPVIGLCGQFLLMPLLSFGLGFPIFPNHPNMRLGMFFTGVSPGGGSSNIWTFILGGNLNLSLAMTAVSTILSFGLMPAWLFSLGRVVFEDANIVVPYARIGSFIVSLLVPLGIGLAMQKWTPRAAAFMVRILKGFSTLLLIFIVVFAIVTNLYIFELFTWQIYVAGMLIPWLGYVVGYAAALLLKQPHADALAIGIETGNQNTGIAIFLLRFALPQPDADLTTVVPVSVAIMSPLPMIAIYIIQRIIACSNRNKKQKEVEDDDDTQVQVDGTKELKTDNNGVTRESKTNDTDDTIDDVETTDAAVTDKQKNIATIEAL